MQFHGIQTGKPEYPKDWQYYQIESYEYDYWRYAIEASKLVVIVNGNNFLRQKHGFVFQDESDRAEIIDSIRDVNFTVVYDDCSHLGAVIDTIKPLCFMKGGDRTIDNLHPDEVEACKRQKTKIICGVGGTDKPYSSSKLLEQYYQWRTNSLNK